MPGSVAEAAGGFRWGEPVDADGARDFVAAVPGLVGFEDERGELLHK